MGLLFFQGQAFLYVDDIQKGSIVNARNLLKTSRCYCRLFSQLSEDLCCTFFKKCTKRGQSYLPVGTCFAHKSLLRLRHSSVASCLAAHYWSQCLGVARLAALKHVPHFSCALLGSSLCRTTLPFRFQRRITFVLYSASSSNSVKRNRHHKRDCFSLR